MKKIHLSIVILFLSITLNAQEYFQQEVNYVISVELDDEKHTLSGYEDIEYINNSSEKLNFIWFHLWPNAYKNNSTKLAKHQLENGDKEIFYAKEYERGFIDSLDFKVNDKKIKWEYHPEHIDICKLILNNPLKPGESIKISTPFFVKIPNGRFSRLGHVDQSYMITQWYPKPAVFDQNGWHPMPYLSQGEFYSEFGSFDVSITLPSNYTVGATGDLQNQDEIIRLNKLAEITKNISEFSDEMTFPKSNSKNKTLRYIQNNIHDFAWFADKRYHVLKGEVKLPYSKDTVILWTMFTNNEADLWKNSIEYMHDAVYYYSLWNGDYPYNHCSAVDGTIAAGGGMEYPNVTVIGESGNSFLLEEVIMHEVGHNWFYGILASNERDYPWMDEGMNSFHELRYMRLKYPKYNMLTNMLPDFITKTLDLEIYTDKQIMGELMYFMNAWTGKDQPIELHSEKYTSINYGGIVYKKTAIVFDYLMAYLGEEVMNDCMKTYFEKWKFKHPQPKDVKNVFEEVSGKDLSWFFDDIIKTTKQLDYSIEKISNSEDSLDIIIKNKGEIEGPVIISGIKNGESFNQQWIEGFKDEKNIQFKNQNYDQIRIDYYGYMPETNRQNNIIKLNGPFKKIEPFKLQIIGSLYNPNKTQIFYSPKSSYNIYNKHSFGISFYNQSLPKNGFSYKISPMYSFGNKNFSGEANFAFKKYSQNTFYQSIKIGVDNKHNLYDYNREYYRIQPYVDIQLKKKNHRSKIDNKVLLSYIHILKDTYFLWEEGSSSFLSASYTHSNKRILNPYSFKTNYEKSKNHNKIELSINLKKDLNQKKQINIRSYIGFVNTKNKIYNLKMSAWNGADDYTFNENTISREKISNHEIPYNRQIIIREGGLKHTTDESFNSDRFLLSTYIDYNMTSLFQLYAELGTNGSNIAYGSGLKVPIGINGPGFFAGFQFYLPVLTENGITPLKDFKNTLRFNMQFDFGGFGLF